jgi:hypothetical protein
MGNRWMELGRRDSRQEKEHQKKGRESEAPSCGKEKL